LITIFVKLKKYRMMEKKVMMFSFKKSNQKVSIFMIFFTGMIHFDNVNVELIENFPCDHANDLICNKNMRMHVYTFICMYVIHSR
jgi:hypothetical protein